MSDVHGSQEYSDLTVDQKMDVHWLYHESSGSFADCISAFIANGLDKEKALLQLKGI